MALFLLLHVEKVVFIRCLANGVLLLVLLLKGHLCILQLIVVLLLLLLSQLTHIIWQLLNLSWRLAHLLVHFLIGLVIRVVLAFKSLYQIILCNGVRMS